MEKKMSFGAKVKEAFRKFLVSLKHKPHNIPMVMLVITFLYYSLNLTHISDTTAKINVSPMGLCGFIVMLFSILSLVCFMNAFPHRKPVNIPMLVIMFVMFAAIIAADVIYNNCIVQAVFYAEKPIQITANTIYIAYAQKNIRIHEILMGVSIVLIVLLPLYAKLIRKIDTSIEVEAGKEMGEIDISSED